MPDLPPSAEIVAGHSVLERVLHAVGNRDITERHRGLRWWTSETEYRLLTQAERKHLRALEAEGKVRFETAGGYPNGWRIGVYSLAPTCVTSPVEMDNPDA